MGCKEALFTLGEKPELRYKAAREALAEMGYASTTDYLFAAAKAVFEETGLLPHLNPGNLDAEELSRLRSVSPLWASCSIRLRALVRKRHASLRLAGQNSCRAFADSC